MSLDSALDPAHSAALNEAVIRPVRCALIDFADEPLRLTNAPYPLAFSGTDDEDLDGFTYAAFRNNPVNVSDVTQNERGADQVSISLSGIIGIDSDIMNVIGDLSLWRGRVLRLWRLLFDANLQMIGYPDPYFTGYLSMPTFQFAATGSTISVTAVSYLASLVGASNRTYLSQSEYDSGDLSAEAAIAIANGIEGNALMPSAPFDIPWSSGFGGILDYARARSS